VAKYPPLFEQNSGGMVFDPSEFGCNVSHFEADLAVRYAIQES